MRLASRRFGLVILIVTLATPAAAQDGPGSPAPTRASDGPPSISFASVLANVGRDLWRLPSVETAITLGAGGALALAVAPADRRLTDSARTSHLLDRTLEAGDPLGSGWVQAGGALGTYVIGRVVGEVRVQEVGADLMRAQIVNSILTHSLKVSVGRTRPDGTAHSFPSGHASATFASAAGLRRHLGWKVGLPAYGVAAYVAASRLQENRHYASDVIFGAAIGIVAGRTVTVGFARRSPLGETRQCPVRARARRNAARCRAHLHAG